MSDKEKTINKSKQKNPRRKRRNTTRPSNFREFETLVKEILEGKDVSYYEWLHQKHKAIILDFNLRNKNEIANLARKDEL